MSAKCGGNSSSSIMVAVSRCAWRSAKKNWSWRGPSPSRLLTLRVAASTGLLRIFAKLIRKSASFQVRLTEYWAIPRAFLQGLGQPGLLQQAPHEGPLLLGRPSPHHVDGASTSHGAPRPAPALWRQEELTRGRELRGEGVRRLSLSQAVLPVQRRPEHREHLRVAVIVAFHAPEVTRQGRDARLLSGDLRQPLPAPGGRALGVHL